MPILRKKLIEVALPLDAINKAMIEIPPKFAGMPPVNPMVWAQMAKDCELGKGASGK